MVGSGRIAVYNVSERVFPRLPVGSAGCFAFDKERS